MKETIIFIIIATVILVAASVYAPQLGGLLSKISGDNKTADQVNVGDDTSAIGEAAVSKDDLVVGTGVDAQNGDKLSVHYVGTLLDGTKFDSSIDRGTAFEFTLGSGQVIRGWDEAVLGMKVGGKRKLTIPPELAYGDTQVGEIPSNSTLVFEIELLSVNGK